MASATMPFMVAPQDEDDAPATAPPTLREVIGSVLAAGLGVQSTKNHERDFSRGSARRYVVFGLLGTLVFALCVYGAVRLILALAGA
ncbi:MAG: DUF2970 domain-containing protein [Gammaproteobacteria bacterium]